MASHHAVRKGTVNSTLPHGFVGRTIGAVQKARRFCVRPCGALSQLIQEGRRWTPLVDFLCFLDACEACVLHCSYDEHCALICASTEALHKSPLGGAEVCTWRWSLDDNSTGTGQPLVAECRLLRGVPWSIGNLFDAAYKISDTDRRYPQVNHCEDRLVGNLCMKHQG